MPNIDNGVPHLMTRADQIKAEKQRQSEEDAKFLRKAKIVGGFCVAVVLVLLVGYLIFRDTWERDNEPKLVELKASIDAARARKDVKAAFASSEEALALIGQRNLLQQNLIDIKEFAVKTKAELGDAVEKIKAAEAAENQRQQKIELAEAQRRNEEAQWRAQEAALSNAAAPLVQAWANDMHSRTHTKEDMDEISKAIIESYGDNSGVALQTLIDIESIAPNIVDHVKRYSKEELHSYASSLMILYHLSAKEATVISKVGEKCIERRERARRFQQNN